MENKNNIGSQNTQQIGQNSVSQNLQIPEKPKVNYRVISTVVLLIVLFVGFSAWFAFSKIGKNNFVNQTSQIPTPTTSTSMQPVIIKTLNLEAQSIGDSTTKLFFSENNSLYSTKRDGVVRNLTLLEGNITNILFLPEKKDLLIVTEKPEVLKEEYDKATNKMIPVIDPHTAYWVFKEETQKLEKFPYNLTELFSLRDIEEMTRFEKIYTKVGQSGGADILLDKLDGSFPVEIGFLKDKPLERQTCEIGNNCTEKFFPRQFIPSFDESFLLSSPPRGGGLGEPAVVVSRDGSKIYKIDLYWYVSAATWIDNNKLLAQDQKGSKVFTFNNDGTFVATDIPSGIGDQFNQRTLSPNKKYIGVITFNPNYEVGLFDVNTFEKRVVETVNPVTPGAIDIIGWNEDSTKMLYVVNDEAKIYSINSGKTEVVASLKNGAPEWVRSDRPAFAKNIFEIR